VLHLCGFDHEADAGEMLELQDMAMRTLEHGPRVTGDGRR